jgi:hypothetical protein
MSLFPLLPSVEFFTEAKEGNEVILCPQGTAQSRAHGFNHGDRSHRQIEASRWDA